jgi:hypothetical protein
MSLPNEEFDVLGKDELALLTRRFERMHENWVNSRRKSHTCFRCGKQEHFVPDCLKEMEAKDSYKNRLRTESKHHSRCEHNHKNKDKRRSRRKDGHS